MSAKGIVVFSLFLGVVLLGGPSPTPPGAGAEPAPAGGPSVTALSGPLHFIANVGQTDARALFYADAPGYSLWLTREGLVFDLVEKAGRGAPARSVAYLNFKGVNEDFELIASDPSAYRVSYFFGRDESDWKTDIPTTKAVLYKNLYDGIDLRVYGAGREVEYDWIVGPGADPSRIRLAYSGGHEAKLDGEGNLVVETPSGRILHRAPRAYQIIDGRRVEVEAAFRETAGGAYGFELGSYDPRRELTIDPLVLAFSTYLGGSREDTAYGAVADSAGALYVWGVTSSKNFPPRAQTLPRDDYFVTKMAPDGKTLVYSAFFPRGGSAAEGGGIGVDAKGIAYFAARTESNAFPLKNPFQAAFGGGQDDGFFLKLSKDGLSLVYSSYIGGRSHDGVGGVAIDASGAAYLAGWTDSPDFPTVDPVQKALRGDDDAFVAKVAPDGRELLYSTYLGGTAQERSYRVAVDADGAAVVAGETQSRDFPLGAGFQKRYAGGKNDLFVSKLAPEGDRLLLSSYLGGKGDDYFGSLALDGSGAIYLAGSSDGGFPVKNAYQKTRKGRSDAFLTKVEPGGKSVVFSTYLGGESNDFATGLAVDGKGTVFIGGWTYSRDFPLKTPFQPRLRGSEDGFLTILDPGGLKLVYSTLMGGSLRDYALGLCLGPDGSVFVAGETLSLDFPVKDAYQKPFAGGGWDAFVLKLKPGSAGVVR
jgi:hypothetical protein